MTKLSTILSLAVAMLANSAGATVLTAKISVDDNYFAFVSTSPTSTGTNKLGEGHSRTTTYVNTATLTAGIDYYLMLRATDNAGATNIAGFLGEFLLDGNHRFANGLSTLTTNTTDWQGGINGYTEQYIPLTDIGPNGTGSWGTRANIDASAHWIWAGNPVTSNQAYFVTKISAFTPAEASVPEPGTIALLGLGMASLLLLRRKKAV